MYVVDVIKFVYHKPFFTILSILLVEVANSPGQFCDRLPKRDFGMLPSHSRPFRRCRNWVYIVGDYLEIWFRFLSLPPFE